jgi:hypothetical protein
MFFPGRETPRRRVDARRVLGDDEGRRGDPAREDGVHSGVVPVDPAAEHGDRVPARLERAPMGVPVDPARESAHDDDPGGSQLTTEHARYLRPVRRAGAGADDRHRRHGKQVRIARPAQIQPCRRIVDRPQQRRQIQPVEDGHVASSAGVR